MDRIVLPPSIKAAMKNSSIMPVLVGILILLCTNSYALGPVDGEIGIAWWANDFEADLADADIDAGLTFVYGEGWLGDKWGVRGAWYDSNLEGEAISNQTRFNLEARRKMFSASDNNFFALGAGIENIDLENGGDAQGFRVSAEGRFGVPGPVFFYGRIAWVPELGDAKNFDDISAQEFDAGIHITPIPFMSLRIGYMKYELDYDNTATGLGGGSSTSGFYLGGGFHW
jgi:hypothetical protein